MMNDGNLNNHDANHHANHHQPHAIHPPMDPPPFGPAAIRQCIKANVRIQNHPDPQNHNKLHEVLILTSLVKSLDDIIRAKEVERLRNLYGTNERDSGGHGLGHGRGMNGNDNVGGSGGQNNYDDGDGDDNDDMSLDDDDDSLSDFSESSSSSSSEEEETNTNTNADADNSTNHSAAQSSCENQGVDDATMQNDNNNNNIEEEEVESGDFALDSEDSSSSSEFISSDEDDSENDNNFNRNNNNNINGGGRRQPQNREVNPSTRMKAFWLTRELSENRHGIFISHVYYAKVLYKADLYWIVSDEEVAIKVVTWRCLLASRNRLSEDFVKEIAALQYISEWHATQNTNLRQSHVITPDTVMYNDTHLFIVMPYCPGGDLCMKVAEQISERFTEDMARFYFRQILKGIETLQKAQVCHRDLSPENFIILDDTCIVIDFGMSLRIPYSADGRRHLITEQHPCGKLPHISPEIWKQRPFDGHAVDVWAVATVLLFMLTGRRLEKPPEIDRAFEHVDLRLSKEVMDLIRKMFRLNPEDRLTLEQIWNHSWVR